jgi:hypothetical protein
MNNVYFFAVFSENAHFFITGAITGKVLFSSISLWLAWTLIKN